jgi:GDPmannose 4,6-dehydratase
VNLDWNKYVRLDPRFLRPAEVDHLIGDSSKGRAALGWQPEVDFIGLVQMMVDADLERLSRTPSRPAGVESR